MTVAPAPTTVRGPIETPLDDVGAQTDPARLTDRNIAGEMHTRRNKTIGSDLTIMTDRSAHVDDAVVVQDRTRVDHDIRKHRDAGTKARKGRYPRRWRDRLRKSKP